MIVKSKITKVTVYSDRAEITRNSENELPKGDHRLIFDMLPGQTEPDSIQVKGHGSAILKDVKFRGVYFDEHPDYDMTALIEKEAAIQDNINELTDRIKHSEQEKIFIENIASSITTPSGENYTPVIDPQKWISIVEFYRSRLDSVDRDIRAAKKEINTWVNRHKKISEEIGEIAGRGNRQKNQVEVTVEMKNDGKLSLDISYIVYGPSWEPVYNFSVSSAEKIMTISYNANIQQNTSEDWDDVAVKLSTARPNINGEQPELAPWHLSIYNHVSMRSASMPASSPELPAAMTQMFRISEEEEYSEGALRNSFDVEEADVETGLTSVVFNVNGINSIKSDNQQYKVAILIRDFSAQFRYSSVPKLSPYAYLKAKVKNDTDFPFLPGETNIFLDNNFIANGYQNLVVPSEEFWTFLGIDESIMIEHKLIKKFEMTEGIISKTTVIRYEYLITVKNKKKTEEEVVIWDQIPISENESIKVELVDPVYKKNSVTLKMDDNNFLEWFYKLSAGEELKIPLVFTVEFPKNSQISGLI
jgi:uncharacterized protein (TIGR02231 family)